LEGLVKITPDAEKAKSMVKMALTTLDMANSIDYRKFPSNVVKELYDVLRELMSATLLLDGWKTKGDGAHKKQIEYMAQNYSQITGFDADFLERLRNLRNRIAYDGFFVDAKYIKENRNVIDSLILKLRLLLKDKLK